jgi:hypothetical protein
MPAVMQTDGDSFWTGAIVPDKQAVARQAEAALAAKMGTPAAARPLPGGRTPQISGYNSAGVLGSFVDVWFNDTVNTDRGWFDYCAEFDNGSGDTGWWGWSPFYAQHLSYSQRWVFNGISIGVSVPGGANFSGSGNTVRWSNGYSYVYYVSHGYTGVRGCTGLLGIMYSVYEQHSSDWQITYTVGQYVQANASKGVG